MSNDFLPFQRGNERVMADPISQVGLLPPAGQGQHDRTSASNQMHPTFVEKFQAFYRFTQRVDKFHLEILSHFFYPRRLALAVVEQLFLAASSISAVPCTHCTCGVYRCHARLACTSFASATCSHNSASKISGYFITLARMISSAACSFRLVPELAGKAS